MKRVRFLCEYSPINTYQKSRRRSLTPGKKISNAYYTQKKANNVGKRMHIETINDIICRNRINNESLVEKLLIKYKLYSKINKIYRLSDKTLHVIQIKLS